MINPSCPMGLGWVCWVCENHPHLAWTAEGRCVERGVGKRCECNGSEKIDDDLTALRSTVPRKLLFDRYALLVGPPFREAFEQLLLADEKSCQRRYGSPNIRCISVKSRQHLKVPIWLGSRQARRQINLAFPIIYMTGSAAGEWASQGVPNSILIEKPFAPSLDRNELQAAVNFTQWGSIARAPRRTGVMWCHMLSRGMVVFLCDHPCRCDIWGRRRAEWILLSKNRSNAIHRSWATKLA